MTDYHHSDSNNEEQDKEACLKMEELLASISNNQPSSSTSLVPDVVRLALNAIHDLFLTVSTSYDAGLLAEKKRSFIRYCLRVPQWSLHSLLCVPDATNEAKPMKVKYLQMQWYFFLIPVYCINKLINYPVLIKSKTIINVTFLLVEF